MKGKTNVYNSKVSGEKLHLTLTTNQPAHTDIIGAIITVSYEDTTETYIWNNSQLIINIPLNVNYTVLFSNVDGYKSPDSFSYTSKIGNRFIEVVYLTELVKVTLSASNGESVNGQIVTINGVEHTWNGTAITQKVAFGTTYDVVVNEKSGYTAPSMQTFTASKAERNVDLVYEEEKFGVFIYDIDGKLTNPDDWNTANNSKAVGVAIITDNCRFVVAKEDISDSVMNYGISGTDIPTLTMYGDAESAAADFDGINNTSKIIAASGSSNAAGKCDAYTFPNGKKGYLGAAGEWQVARQNKEDLNSTLTLIGGTTMAEDLYWTSTHNNMYFAWYQCFDSDSYLFYGNKSNKYYVRAFSPYIANPNIIQSNIDGYRYTEDYTISYWEGTTWKLFVESAFNTIGAYIDESNLVRIGGYYICNADISPVDPEEVISFANYGMDIA